VPSAAPRGDATARCQSQNVKSCMLVKYCNAACQRKHWSTHKKECKLQAAVLRIVALFKDPPPPKEDCPICFLPMPMKLICCFSLPPATISSVPIFDFAMANEELANMETETYLSCCGKSICGGCVHSFHKSGGILNCPFCKTNRMGTTGADHVEELMKRVKANDAVATYVLAGWYHHGGHDGLQQDQDKAKELWTHAADLGCSKSHFNLGGTGEGWRHSKKAKFHFEAAAMAGHEDARHQLGVMDYTSGTAERSMNHITIALNHWIIAASAGSYHAMHNLIPFFKSGFVRENQLTQL